MGAPSLSGWFILLRAHDHVWRDRHVPLAERMASCDLIHRLMIEEQRQARSRCIAAR